MKNAVHTFSALSLHILRCGLPLILFQIAKIFCELVRTVVFHRGTIAVIPLAQAALRQDLIALVAMIAAALLLDLYLRRQESAQRSV